MENEMEKKLIGTKVIVRANTAGVHAGEVEAVDFSTNTIMLKNARRIWQWKTRDRTGSISDIQANGLTEDAENHIGATVPRVTIPNREGLEIGELTEKAWQSIVEHD